MTNQNQDKQSVPEPSSNNTNKMTLLLELQNELTELMKHNVEEMDALREENARMQRKWVEANQEISTLEISHSKHQMEIEVGSTQCTN